ncbi:MAG: acetylornithine/succinylornithine family transaminase [Gammaproteobacteria bacterium]|nr:acetylornithine/succinylornithine family transaminase [Gammaproteobacteria bacterium]
MNHLMNNYNRIPVSFSHGEGAVLWDTDGKQYLDALGGIAVCALGHAHPAVTAAVCDQAGKLVHTSNIYEIAVQRELADKLCGLSAMDNAFFCNSGAEANEAAIKMARLYGHQKGIEIPNIIVMEGSFHGRTLATLTATGNRKIQAGFEPLVKGFVRAPYNDTDAVATIAKNNKDVVAVMVEPITGEGGIRIPAPDYLNKLRAICDQHGWLLILDEIQSGMGRTGKWFAHQHNGIQADIMTLAKALGNGVPIGACLARGPAATLFKPGNHGTTFGGNPLASRAALAVIESIEKDQLLQKADTLGKHFLDGFGTALSGVKGINSIRGKGLMLAVELDRPCGDLVKRCLAQGVLINVTADSVIRLLPPYVMTTEQADTVISVVSDQIRQFLAA